ncbi:hypothetical protein COU74_02145 [Candidatus Peregrinibacteria bacterium CG10_big_fil_rev_8_21_14_0_10_36_19]|nr:MAG: hypothetical protein COU74_02145 [Candidatus Peregrinibacteria bacterium CG10_big_fil_rev_8_21_14_0_10_36_19]
MLKKFISLMAIVMVMATTTVANAAFDPNAPHVVSANLTKETLNPLAGESTILQFSVDKDAFVIVQVRNYLGQTVKSFSSFNGNDYYLKNTTQTLVWDGTDDYGTVVENATYKMFIIAKSGTSETIDNESVTIESKYVGGSTSGSANSTTGGTNNSNPVTNSIQTSGPGAVSLGAIEDFTINPSGSWDPTDDLLDIEFELNKDVNYLYVEAVSGSKHVEIIDDEYADEDSYEESWDGTDDDGDYIKPGVWEIIVRADGDKISKTINVQYEKPSITEAFVTKNSFDPEENEKMSLVFKVDTTSLVTIEVYNGTKREERLWDEVSTSKNKWYVVEWDGTDDEGDTVNEGKDWSFKIYSQNTVADKVLDTKSVSFEVKEDTVSSSKTVNVTNDYMSPVVYEKTTKSVTFGYCLDDEADVYLAVYEGKNASGKPEAELLDYVSQSSGCHKVEWNGEDDKGKTLSKGVYSYKVISKNGSSKDTEEGVFVVGTAGDSNSNDNDNDDDDYDYTYDCSDYYYDTASIAKYDTEMCQAITWVTENGVFSGYSNGNFGANATINRAEFLKVLLDSYGLQTFGFDGSNAGFKDVSPYEWYMPYVITAKFYGIFDGYPDKTARLTNTINRAELMKIVVETDSTLGYGNLASYAGSYGQTYKDVPANAWFKQYADVNFNLSLLNSKSNYNGFSFMPEAKVTRGEVALLLYRKASFGF